MNQCSVEGGSEVVPLASASGFTILATHLTTAPVPEFVILNLCWMNAIAFSGMSKPSLCQLHIQSLFFATYLSHALAKGSNVLGLWREFHCGDTTLMRHESNYISHWHHF